MPSVIITGANRGLGLEFARQYAAAGWRVVAACRRPAEARELARVNVERVALDVADLASVEAIGDKLAGQPIDVLINNAGVYGDGQTFGAIDAKAWDHVLRVNAIAPIKMAESLLPHILAGERKTMVFITSLMGSIGDNRSGGSILYRTSKAALNAAVKCLSFDLQPKGIRTVLLSPGWVKTDMGGPGAAIDPSTSVGGMRRVIDGLGPETHGTFLDYTGASLPW
jgi:NAD(P)-dependent dehydrogenase (short-subunit alcohol dehydrogenase family)